MILVDTSAWIEFLRGTGSAEGACVRGLLITEAALACCDPVRMEVLAGARDEQHLRDLRGLLGRAESLPAESVDFETAAAIYRACRSQGHTIRKPIDCLIAAVAIRNDVALLHRDEDFTAIQSATSLRIHTQ